MLQGSGRRIQIVIRTSEMFLASLPHPICSQPTWSAAHQALPEFRSVSAPLCPQVFFFGGSGLTASYDSQIPEPEFQER